MEPALSVRGVFRAVTICFAECLDELSFNSGELIMLKSRYGKNWFRGKLINGKEGIFPKNFVEVVVSWEGEGLGECLGLVVVFFGYNHHRHH